MDYEEDMRPEKRTMPNYFNEWSGFEDEPKSNMTVNNYYQLYEIEMKKNNIEMKYGSDFDDFYN